MRMMRRVLVNSLLLITGIPLPGSLWARDQSTVSPIAPCTVAPGVKDPDHMVRPQYPSEALEAGREGSVVLRVAVDGTGKMTELTVVKGEPVFAKASIAAVRKWRFHPVLVEARSVETIYKVEVIFVQGPGSNSARDLGIAAPGRRFGCRKCHRI